MSKAVTAYDIVRFAMDVYGLKKADGDAQKFTAISRFLADHQRANGALLRLIEIDAAYTTQTKAAEETIRNAAQKRDAAYLALVQETAERK